ncbi:MAG: TraR/DksA C4-type zinc finger protein [Bdellovibrionales bacterium]|nr:TraR/DksA C4-type zinc finger protein [Bdellovibrionales bacterium]
MRKATVLKFKRLFLQQRESVLYADKVLREDFSVSTDDRMDEVDQASSDAEQAMRMRLCNREVLYVKKLDEALRRIEDGTFGTCTECDEDIELRRLEARPTATLCVSCKEEEERREGMMATGRLHKSLGETFSRRYA